MFHDGNSSKQNIEDVCIKYWEIDLKGLLWRTEVNWK